MFLNLRRHKAIRILYQKCTIALKETLETKYWIELLVATDYLAEEQGTSILNDCEEVGNLLASIIKTSKAKNEK